MLRILHLEDRHEDALIIERAVTESGIPARFKVVRDQAEFKSALEADQFDLVLADNGLPGFDGLSALAMARRKFTGIGFICVSGTASEWQIQKSLAAGATDYVLKDDLARLVTAVRREREKAQLQRKNQGMTRLIAAVQELSLARDLATVMAIVRRAARELTGADGATFVLRDGDRCHYADEDAIAPLWKGQRFPMTACISGWTMLHRQPAVIEDIYADSRIPADAYRPTFVKSLAMVPIRTEAPIGAIGNYWATHHQPTAEEVELLQALANTTSVAMENVRVYGELEARVRERTAQLQTANAGLEEANRELDSFAHAVSHDLGAPLRSVQAFTRLAVEDAKTKLSEQSKQHLAIVQSSAKQMRTVMDDLLRLSQVVRTALRKRTVSLTGLAREVTGLLAEQSPARKVEVVIAEGMEAQGDYGLLHIALENLLANAWKYTSKREDARIEFAEVTQPDGSRAYCIRDNGAGFDMAWSEQLFQPFKRLHRQEEFPGTGIGLTTVQRIIRRHGGRIWAEGKVNQGAAFYFTLA